MKKEVERLLKVLSERERDILSLRFGLEDDIERTLKEVGKNYEMSGERIRQIESKVLKKLKRFNRCKKLRNFLIEE